MYITLISKDDYNNSKYCLTAEPQENSKEIIYNITIGNITFLTVELNTKNGYSIWIKRDDSNVDYFCKSNYMSYEQLKEFINNRLNEEPPF